MSGRGPRGGDRGSGGGGGRGGGGRGGRGAGGGDRGGGGGYDRGGRGGGGRGGGGGDRGGGGGGYDRGGRGGGGGGYDRGGGGGGYDRGGRGGGGGGYDRGGRGGGGGGYERGGGGGGYDRGGRGGGGGGRGGGRGGGGGPAEFFRGSSGSIPAPSAQSQQVEDRIAANVSSGNVGQLPDISELNLDQRLPKRPGYSNQGILITVWANYFAIVPKPELRIFRFDIKITPDVKGPKKARVIGLLITEGAVAAAAPGIATDFKAILLTAKPLSAQQLTNKVMYRLENEDSPGEKPQEYTIKLQQTGSFAISSILDYLASATPNAGYGEKEEVIQALNIIMGHYPKSLPSTQIASLGANRHYMRPESIYNLTSGLEAWRGYFMSVRPAASRLILNVQIKSAAMYKGIKLGALMGLYIGKWQQAPPPYNQSQLRGLEPFLRKLRITATHLQRKNKKGVVIQRVKTISGLATIQDGKFGPEPSAHPPRVAGFGATPDKVEFYLSGDNPPKAKKPGGVLRTNGYISVMKYFDIVYNIQVDDRYPVVNVGNKSNPSYIPVEACEVLDGQPAPAKLNPDQTANMIGFAVRKAYENADSVAKEAPSAMGLKSTNKTLMAFGLGLDDSLLTARARVLQGPRVNYQNSSINTRFGSWNMSAVKFCKTGALPRWAIIWIMRNPKTDPWQAEGNALRSKVMEFQAELRKCGIRDVGEARPPAVIHWPNPTALSKAFDDFKPAQLILVILPDRDDDIYATIKKMGEIEKGKLTVCVTAQKFNTANAQYMANVALKFNLKLGGVNQSLDKGKLGFFTNGKTMLVGIDVTHPSPGSMGHAPSIAGMVASIDADLAQYPAILSRQEPRAEMVTGLGAMLKTRLALWKKHNKQALPENIVVYRDGVSEGQYKLVVGQEIPLLKAACEEVYGKGSKFPAMSVIIVGKRHHTRFYPTAAGSNNLDRSSNCTNGTLVDRDVTEPRNWDFFLQAHAAIQGTARPAHYYVVHDEIFAKMRPPPPFNNPAEVLQDYTHNMCYMFGRATKAVSLCPPAYYADMVCERARCYLRGILSPGNTPGPSNNPSIAGDTPAAVDLAEQDRALKIHDNIKDTMFYI